jgi:hypothetical protein
LASATTTMTMAADHQPDRQGQRQHEHREMSQAAEDAQGRAGQPLGRPGGADLDADQAYDPEHDDLDPGQQAAQQVCGHPHPGLQLVLDLDDRSPCSGDGRLLRAGVRRVTSGHPHPTIVSPGRPPAARHPQIM